MRPLLIGQAPGPRSDPAEPLAGRCGARLAYLCGLPLDEFMRRFERVNLLDRFPGKNGKGDAFDRPLAERGAVRLAMAKAFVGRQVVLLGGHVAGTFGFRGEVPLLAFDFTPLFPGGVALCPHPSGISMWWNEPANVDAAREFWRVLARYGA